MLEFFTNINVDWMGLRKPLTAISIAILLAGLLSAVGRQFTRAERMRLISAWTFGAVRL
jgi:hypothetical protein